MTEPTKPRRRRFGLSLRALMVLVLVFGGVLGWKARRATLQRQAVNAIHGAGGAVLYDYQFTATNATGLFVPSAQPWAPAWLRRPIGDEYFQEVNSIFLQNANPTLSIKSDPRLFEALATLDQARMLNTLRYPMNDDEFARIMAMPRLSRVCLVEIDITDAGLECLASAPAIEELRFRSKPGAVTARGLELIARQPRIKNLEILRIDLPDPSSLAPLSKLANLEYLNLQDSPRDDSCLGPLRNLTELKKLDLRRTCLTDAGIDALAKLTKLENLLMDGSKLTDAGLARLAAIPSLKEIYLDPLPNLGEVGISSLDKLKGFSTLTLRAADVTDAGLAHLKGLTLLRVTVSGAGVTDEGLSNLVATNQIVELDLSRTSVTAKGLSVLANQTGLRWLAFDGTKVDDNAAAELANLPTLGFLSLDETPITDAALVALQKSTSLLFLRVRGTNVTPQGLEAFSKARPDIVVKSGPPTAATDGR